MTAVPRMETKTERGHGVGQQCSSCDASSARCWCQDCNEALCDDCVSAHRRVTLTRSHRILNQPTAGGVSTPPTKFCRLHPSEALKLFCFTCKQLTCRDCQLMTHMNHRYQFVKEAVDTLKKQLELRAQPIRTQRDRVRRSLQDMEARLQDIAESEAQLKKELQQSLKFITQHLEKRMEHLLNEVKTVCESETEKIQRRMMKLKQLQQNQQSVTETAEEAKDSSDLSALLSYTARLESQLKDLPLQVPQDSSPQMMSDMKVLTDEKSLRALLSFGQLQVSWIPFSVSQTSNQNTDSPAAASASPPTPTDRPLPHTVNTCDVASPVPDNRTCPPSSSVTPATSTFLSPSLKPLPHAGNTKSSPVPVSCPSSSNQLSVYVSTSNSSQSSIKYPSPSTMQTPSHLSLNSGQAFLPKNLVQPASPSVRFGFLSSTAPSSSCTVLQLVQPSLLLNQPAAPSQKQSASVLLTNSQTVYQVSSVPQFPVMLSQTAAVSPNIWQEHRAGSSSTCKPLPQTKTSNDTGSPNPNNRLASLWKSSSSNQLRLLPSSCKPLPQTKTSNNTGSANPNNRLASLWKSSSSNQLRLPPSFFPTIAPRTDNTCGAASPVPDNQLTTSQKALPNQMCPPASPSCKPLSHIGNTCDSPVPVSCPSSSSVNQSSSALETMTQMVKHPSSHLETKPGQVSMNHVQNLSTSVATTGIQTCDGPGRSTPPNYEQTSNQEPLKEVSEPGASSSPERPLKQQQQQSPVVRAVADSACDRSVQQVAARQQEPAENEPTSTVSEESEPAGKPPERDAEEPSSVIGRLDCLSQWQPRVSLYRMPVSLPRPGSPLPSFRLVPGDAEDEIYLEEISEDIQSHTDDITDDIMEPLSSPESPVTLQIVSCSACGSAYASIICSACGRGFHRDCHVPPVGPDIWSEWMCSLCQDLSDPSDPYSSDRPQRPQSPCLSLLDQRRCESLLLHLKVEGCTQLSEVGSVWSHVKSMSERLSLRRSPSYQTAAQFLSDIWSLFRLAQDDDRLDQLQQSFQSRLAQTFGSELHPSVLTLLCRNTKDGSEVGDSEGGSEVTSEEQDAITSESKLTETRKRLKEFLGRSGSKRRRMDQSSPSGYVAKASCFRPFSGENKRSNLTGGQNNF